MKQGTQLNTIHGQYQTATCFGSAVPTSDSLLVQGNTCPTR